MRPATLVLTGLPQFVTLVELSYNLDILFDTNDIGTFKIRDVTGHMGKRKIELDFSSTYDAFAAQSRLDGYVYELSSDQHYQQYTLSAKLLKKKNMANAINRWRSDSLDESQTNWNAIALPTMSGEIIEQAHAKLDVQLNLLKKQQLVLKAQKAVLKAKKKLQKEYSQTSSGEQPTTSRLCTSPRNRSRSKCASRERQTNPVKHLETPPLETQSEKPVVSKRKSKRKPRKKLVKKSRFWNRSRSRSPSPFKNGGSSSTKRRSLFKNRISKSRSPDTESRRSSTRNLPSPSKKRRSPSKNQRSRSNSRRSSVKRQSSSSNQRTPSRNQRSSSKSRRSSSKRQSSPKRQRTPSRNRRSRSKKRSRSKNRQISSRKRRSSSRKRRSNSRNRRSRSRDRRSRSRDRRSRCRDRRSRSKNRRSSPRYRRSTSKHRNSSSKKLRCRSRSRIRRSRSKYSRSRSPEVRKHWRSRSRDSSRERSPKYRARTKATRTLWSPELHRNRSRSREIQERRLFKKDSSSRSAEYSRLAIMPVPIATMEDPHSIIVKRKYCEAPVSEYYSDPRITDYYDVEDHSSEGVRYICEADKDENVTKCTELDTNIPKLTDIDCKWSVSDEEIKKETLDPIGQAHNDNSVVEKPLVEILLGICKDSSVASKTGPLCLNDGNVLDSRVEAGARHTVSDNYNYLDNKKQLSIAPTKGTKINNKYIALHEIHTTDTNTNEDIKPVVVDLTKNLEIVKTNSSSVHHKFKLRKDKNIDEDIKPIIDLENISTVIEVKDEIPSLRHLQTTKNDYNFHDDIKPDKENIFEEEAKNTRPLPKRPKFVIVVRTLMKEMEPSLKKAKHDYMKKSFQCKFIYVLRRTLRNLVLGKDVMRSSEILRVFRQKYPKEQDDRFVRQLVEDIKAGKYGNLGPSDDDIADGDDVVLVENENDIILIDSDISDDESKPLQPRNDNVNSRSPVWSALAGAPNNPPTECPPTKPRVLIPYPNKMGSRTDKGNTYQGTEVKLESNDVVPEFNDMELDNIRKCMKGNPTNNLDGTETPHVTGITIMTSLSELFSLKYDNEDTKKEQDIKKEHNALSEEYMHDNAQYYNPYLPFNG